MILHDVLYAYRAALARWLPFLAAHLFIRLIVTSLMVPLIAVALSVTLLFSNQTSLTDQDIAKFLFTPAGLIGAFAILCLLITALVLDVVVATAILRQRARKPSDALRLATGFVLRSLPRLLPFILQLLVRVLAILVPFVVVGGAIAFFLITDHDINFYLTQRPPEFLTAVALIGCVLVVLAFVLLQKLSGWAVALHLALLDKVSASASFATSAQHMTGRRIGLVGRIVGWAALRFAALAVAGALAALVMTWVLKWQPDSLHVLAMAMITNGVVYSVCLAFVNAVSNGALAGLLNEEFEEVLDGRVPAFDASGITDSARTRNITRLAVAALGVAALAGIGTGGVLVERAKQDADAQIIAHRGAAAMAPENTMASVKRAIEDGADWIEIDVQESAEGTVIVAHDSDFMKAANVPTKVWDVTASDLADIDIGSWFDPAFSQERVPLLSDVLLAARDKVRVLIELKYYGHDQDLERRVAQIVETTGMTDQIATMSLKYPAVQKMRALRPDWDTGVLAATSIGDMTGLEGDFLALNQARINPLLVEQANAAGKDVYAWTVNDPATIVRMLWIGVNGLITDDPAHTREVMDKYNALSVAERVILALSDRVRTTIDLGAVEELRP
ncbi:MAG: glycerophosphodiester phosphodiesterase family protein [Pseudomonadota bacterium]